MAVQQEIESHEQELRTLLTRVLPMGQVMVQLDAQQAHVTALAEAVDLLRNREIPLVLISTSQIDAAIKKTNRALDSLSEQTDEHEAVSALLREHAGGSQLRASRIAETLAALGPELRESQSAVSAALSRLSDQLKDQQRELSSLVQPLVGDIAASRKDALGSITALADRVQVLSDEQKSASDRASLGSISLRRLIVASVVMSSVSLAGVLGLLAGIFL
jgi:chromosome segregation ATPase